MSGMRLAVVAALALAVVVVTPGDAEASDVACFDWSCDWNTATCTFDPSCSSADPFIWKLAWDWGDGGGTGLTGTQVQTHTYSSETCQTPTVTLWVYAWSGNIVQVSCYVMPTSCPQWPALWTNEANCTSG